jgi:hypothetical protein
VLLGRSRGFLVSSWVLLGSSWGLLGSSWELLGSAWVLLGPGHEKQAKVASGKTSKVVTYKGSNAFSKNTKTAFTERNLRFWSGSREAIVTLAGISFGGGQGRKGEPSLILRASQVLLRGFGVLLGSSWGLLGSSWGRLGSSWELPGGSWGAPWSSMGAP